MHQLQLQITDRLYDQAKRRAVEAGFGSVEEYASDVLASERSDEMEAFFTPDRVAHLDRVAAGLDAGAKPLSVDEVRDGLAKNRAGWLQKNGR